MFKSVYATSLCDKYQVDNIVNGIRKSIITHPDSVEQYKEKPLPYYIGLVTPRNEDVVTFAHPVIVINNQANESKELKYIPQDSITKTSGISVYVDVRNCTRLNKEGVVQITSQLDYDFIIRRAALSRHVVSNPMEDLLGLTAFPLMVYTKWLTESLGRKLGVEPDVMLRMQTIIAFYYLCQFDTTKLESDDYLTIATQINKSTLLPTEGVLSIIDKIERLNSIHDLIEALKVHGKSLRFDSLNTALVYSIIGGSWFGFNHRELMAVAIEHIPTWIAILYSACHEKGYRNTLIGKLVKDYSRGNADKIFVRNVDLMLDR